MRLFLIYRLYESVEERLRLFREACELCLVEFVPINSDTVDYSDLPTINAGDLLYNCSDGSETLESILLTPEIVTFYIKQPQIVCNNSDTVKYCSRAKQFSCT